MFIKAQVCILFIFTCICHSLFAQSLKHARLTAWIDSVSTVKKDTGTIFLYGDYTVWAWKNPGSLHAQFQTKVIAHKNLYYADLNFHFEKLVKAMHPGAIMVHLGLNEVKAGRPLDSITRDIKIFLRHAHRQLPGVLVVLLAPQPSPATKKYNTSLKGLYQKMADLAVEYPNCAYLDCISFMTQDGERFFPKHFLSDSTTLSETGYALWSAEIKKQTHTLFSTEE